MPDAGLPRPFMAVLRSYPDSAKVNAVSEGAEALYLRLLMVADDHGRFHGSAVDVAGKVLARRVFAGQLDLPAVEQRLAELDRERLIRRYQVDGEQYLEISQYHSRIRTNYRRSARFPPPVGVDLGPDGTDPTPCPPKATPTPLQTGDCAVQPPQIVDGVEAAPQEEKRTPKTTDYRERRTPPTPPLRGGGEHGSSTEAPEQQPTSPHWPDVPLSSRAARYWPKLVHWLDARAAGYSRRAKPLNPYQAQLALEALDQVHPDRVDEFLDAATAGGWRQLNKPARDFAVPRGHLPAPAHEASHAELAARRERERGEEGRRLVAADQQLDRVAQRYGLDRAELDARIREHPQRDQMLSDILNGRAQRWLANGNEADSTENRLQTIKHQPGSSEEHSTRVD